MRNILTATADTIGFFLMITSLYIMMVFGQGYENYVRCEKGATEFCEVQK